VLLQPWFPKRHHASGQSGCTGVDGPSHDPRHRSRIYCTGQHETYGTRQHSCWRPAPRPPTARQRHIADVGSHGHTHVWRHGQPGLHMPGLSRQHVCTGSFIRRWRYFVVYVDMSSLSCKQQVGSSVIHVHLQRRFCIERRRWCGSSLLVDSYEQSEPHTDSIAFSASLAGPISSANCIV